MPDITNTADILDIRDIIERFEELRDEREQHTVDCDFCRGDGHMGDATDDQPEPTECCNCGGSGQVTNTDDWEVTFDEDATELASLQILLDDLKGYGGGHQ